MFGSVFTDQRLTRGISGDPFYVLIISSGVYTSCFLDRLCFGKIKSFSCSGLNLNHFNSRFSREKGFAHMQERVLVCWFKSSPIGPKLLHICLTEGQMWPRLSSLRTNRIFRDECVYSGIQVFGRTNQNQHDK